MDEHPAGGSGFRRGPERRTCPISVASDRRVHDRRAKDLGWIPLFRGASVYAVDEALADCDVLLLPAGTPLLRPGEDNKNVYVLLSGQMAAHLDVGLHPNAGFAIRPGECIGEFSAIDGKPVSALVVAVSTSRVLKLPQDVFWNRLMALPGIATNLMKTLTERMRLSNEHALKAQRRQLELDHLRKELDVARQLQISMLPLQRPLFPERKDLEICGLMEPAADVGGDLFDAFFVDDNHLFICIGDVSGHGIAAALFMARTIGLLRLLAMNIGRPEQVLEVLNDRLCTGNDTNIFVTLFCGFVDIRSGRLIYSNAGHCAPFLSHGGAVVPLPIPKGALIGAFPDRKYTSMEHLLQPGELILCYTDGVTEAQDPDGNEFSEERCAQHLALAHETPVALLLDDVRLAVTAFTGTETLADDCTMLGLRLAGTQI